MATAGQLVSDDLIADIDGGEAVKVVANALTQTSEIVYNFEVAGNHNYFADELGLWVHNAKGGKIRSPSNVPQHVTDEIREALRKLNKSNPGCSVGEEQDLINAIAKKHNQGKDKIKSLEKFLIRGIRGKNKR